MLNPFPIQFLALLAYLILRVFVGVILIVFAVQHYRQRTALREAFTSRLFVFGSATPALLAVGELVLGSMFILGYYTQIAALATMAMSLKFIVLKRWLPDTFTESRTFYVLLFAVSLSLFITGAGALAFDLPI